MQLSIATIVLCRKDHGYVRTLSRVSWKILRRPRRWGLLAKHWKLWRCQYWLSPMKITHISPCLDSPQPLHLIGKKLTVVLFHDHTSGSGLAVPSTPVYLQTYKYTCCIQCLALLRRWTPSDPTLNRANITCQRLSMAERREPIFTSKIFIATRRVVYPDLHQLYMLSYAELEKHHGWFFIHIKIEDNLPIQGGVPLGLLRTFLLSSIVIIPITLSKGTLYTSVRIQHISHI